MFYSRNNEHCNLDTINFSTGFQMEFCPKRIENNSFTYKLMPTAVTGDNKILFESHQKNKKLFKHGLHQQNKYLQTVFCYAVPIPPNTSENTVIHLGSTMLDTSTYTLSHGIQEQTAHGFSVSVDNSTDIATDGINEETGQTSVTNDIQLNNSRRLPTNDIQENNPQNVGPGNIQIHNSVESITDETQEADRTLANADTQLETGTVARNYGSQAEPDQTLAEQLRLGSLRGFVTILCMHYVLSIYYILTLNILFHIH